MSPEMDEIRRELMLVRSAVASDVHQVRQSARNLRKSLDWRQWVTNHPLVCLGGTALLGALIAPKLLKGKQPPQVTQTVDQPTEGTVKAFVNRFLLNRTNWEKAGSLAAMAGPPVLRMVLAAIAQRGMNAIQATSKPQTAEQQTVSV